MVVTSHGSSPVVERHRRAAADRKSRVYHPFAMPKRRLISRNKYAKRTTLRTKLIDTLLDITYHSHTARDLLFCFRE